MSRINFVLMIEEDSQIESREIQTKKGKMLLTHQESLIMFDLYKPHILQPYKLNLKPESEPLPAGYYALSIEINLDRYGRPQFVPYAPIKVYPLGNTQPIDMGNIHERIQEEHPHKSVSNEMTYKEESQVQSNEIAAALMNMLGKKEAA